MILKFEFRWQPELYEKLFFGVFTKMLSMNMGLLTRIRYLTHHIKDELLTFHLKASVTDVL